MFAHGNRINCAEARAQGLDFYRTLVAQACDERPLRVVVWSWPSERATCGPVPDARLKLARCDADGYYLAWLVDRLDPHERVSLVGYSMGARIDASSLHLLAGGTVDGYALQQRIHPKRGPLRAVLMAAALDCDWLWPERRYGRAWSVLDGMSLVNNGCDRILKRYPKLNYGGPNALGYVGLAQNGLSAGDWQKVEQLDVCCSVGPSHHIARYFRSASIMSAVWHTVAAAPAASH